jgi:hypothetical protein
MDGWLRGIGLAQGLTNGGPTARSGDKRFLASADPAYSWLIASDRRDQPTASTGEP